MNNKNNQNDEDVLNELYNDYLEDLEVPISKPFFEPLTNENKDNDENIEFAEDEESVLCWDGLVRTESEYNNYVGGLICKYKRNESLTICEQHELVDCLIISRVIPTQADTLFLNAMEVFNTPNHSSMTNYYKAILIKAGFDKNELAKIKNVEEKYAEDFIYENSRDGYNCDENWDYDVPDFGFLEDAFRIERKHKHNGRFYINGVDCDDDEI